MAITLGNGTITFGDGSTQSSKTPTVVSAFTNDSSYLIPSLAAATWSTIPNSIHLVTGSASRNGVLYYYSVTGAYLGTAGPWNCNCNC
jgi:hypothetical protein